MRLLRPEMAVWLVVVPALAAGWSLHYLYKWRSRGRGAVAPHVAALSRRSTAGQDATTLLLGLLTAVFLVGAMMRPQVMIERREPQLQRQDLIVVLDRSVSMNARDVRPSRLGRALDEIKAFLQHKPEAIDRVGLVGFAATSIALSYPTRDLDSLFFYLEWARGDPTPMYGTNIGGALATALTAARRDADDTAVPLFVVISDGEDDGEELEHAIATFRRENLRVHSIGIGSHQPVPMPVAGDDGEEFLADEAGQVLMTQFNESTLRRVAAATGGRYFRSVTGGELRGALEAAAVAERQQIGWTTTRQYRDLYLALLAGAGICSVGLMVRL